MHVGHHVVPQLALVALGGGEVDLVDVRPKLLDLSGRNVQPQFGLRLGQPNPKLPPSAKLPLSSPQRAHLARGIAMGQRVLVEFVGHSGQTMDARAPNLLERSVRLSHECHYDYRMSRPTGPIEPTAMSHGFFTIEQWQRPSNGGAGEWIPILHLDARQSITKAKAALQNRGEPGLFRVVQSQRCFWGEIEGDELQLHGSHVASIEGPGGACRALRPRGWAAAG